MKSLSVGNLLEATGGRLVGGDAEVKRSVTQVDTDSRKARGGSLFIPLIGERFDAHAFIEDALEQGAEGCLTDREPKTCREGKFYILVEDTTRALGALAKWYKNRFAVPVVGVTGSVGKTTTKDMIASVLSERFRVLKTDGNFNNEVGLPLTMLRLDEAYEMLVLEMGMSKPGEIEYLSSLAEPDVAVITKHRRFPHRVFREPREDPCGQSEIFLHMKPGRLAILNGDDPFCARSRERRPGRSSGAGRGELRLRALKMTDDGEHMSFCKVKTPTLDGQLTIPALGRHMIYPALMAWRQGSISAFRRRSLWGAWRLFRPQDAHERPPARRRGHHSRRRVQRKTPRACARRRRCSRAQGKL
jgi:UDP-N-acetylmuramoyl-tripeptide--D-alanyl-D-alanine ligase